MKFKYFKLPLEKRSSFFGTSILKPIIPIELSVADIAIRYAALIDSGADFCIFDAEIGENLGLDVRSGIQIDFGGIQEKGGAKAYLHEVKLILGGYAFEIMAGFSYDVAKHGYGILDQKGSFDIFSVKFDLVKEEIELKSH